ncbi:hypothetical protein AJ80_02578 [Polytolypa hystricis UAMH7299]|uniref:Transcription elongation factor Eaf N-terminal domain-containing protein n=1 Tax=Polytolypa hystricis (strain UAMH7299) TaxID=1447883 RepID=A0A2B7YNV3_POLH7|nr:hypothetical protein AJ80_02578 [Polytolypa hystricis UAMH7299]
MTTLSAPSTPSLSSSGPIDPTKQAEYPILLGDKLSKNASAKNTSLINLTYNYKSKSASPNQKATISLGGASPDVYKLTIQDKAGNAEKTNLTYTYRGSVDPTSLVSESDTSNLVLVFDQKRKAFILEPVSSQLNFNLRSAPGKTSQQVAKQYPQLKTLSQEDEAANDDHRQSGGSEDDGAGPADDSNPYDYRHFLPKADSQGSEKLQGDISAASSPDPQHAVSKPLRPQLTPSLPAATKPRAQPPTRSKPQPNPLRQPKRAPKPAATDSGKATKAKPAKPISEERVDSNDIVVESSLSDGEATTQRAEEAEARARDEKSPSANIIVDGDLIIDMGSPPPARPAFKINPAHFTSSNTSVNEADYDSDDEEDIEDLRLPSPAGPTRGQGEAGDGEEEEEEEEEEPRAVPEAEDEAMDDDDDLAAEMEAAFEESAREEEEERARHQQYLQQQQQMESEEESEVSEEE